MNFVNFILLQEIFIFLVVTNIVKSIPVEQDQIVEESQNILDQSTGLLNSAVDLKLNLLTPPIKTRESAKLESEQLPSKILSIYDDKQLQTANNRDIQPIIDTIREEDKYGNNGDKFFGIGRMLVNGYEVFANFLNKAIRVPNELALSISKRVNEKLNTIGGKLVGLD